MVTRQLSGWRNSEIFTEMVVGYAKSLYGLLEFLDNNIGYQNGYLYIIDKVGSEFFVHYVGEDNRF